MNIEIPEKEVLDKMPALNRLIFDVLSDIKKEKVAIKSGEPKR